MRDKIIWGVLAVVAVVALWVERHSESEPDTTDTKLASAAADIEAPDLKSMLSVSLEDKRYYGIGWQIDITNVGQDPITIKQFQVNGRADCDSKASDDLPKTLKVGDRVEMNSPCADVVRAHIVTDQGEADFTFDPATNTAN